MNWKTIAGYVLAVLLVIANMLGISVPSVVG